MMAQRRLRHLCWWGTGSITEECLLSYEIASGSRWNGTKNAEFWQSHIAVTGDISLKDVTGTVMMESSTRSECGVWTAAEC